MEFDREARMAREARERLNAGLGEHDVYIIGSVIRWDDLPELCWEADELGMELTLSRSSFNGGCFVFRFAEKGGAHGKGKG